MRTRVKVCCIASQAEASAAIRAGADALGLVGPMPTGPGVIGDRDIAGICAWVPPPVATFLLTAETTAEGIAGHAAAVGASTVQIVQHIAPTEMARLAERAPTVRRVQVIHVEGEDALAHISLYAPHTHAFLLDSGRPSLQELGGTGRVHDWRISAAFVRASPIPVFLAGGLTAANVGAAIETVKPYGLDLCTGIRTDGHLDLAKLGAFMAAVRAADAAEGTTVRSR